MAEQRTCANGWEMCVGCNHLGHFLLANLLASWVVPNGKIVTVSSSTHHLISEDDVPAVLADPMCSNRRYTTFGQYAVSKLFNLYFASHLPKVHRHVRSYVVHPGLVRTNVVKNMSALMRMGDMLAGPVLGTLQKHPTKGCRSILHCVLLGETGSVLDGMEGRGEYYANSALGWRSVASMNEEYALKVWNMSKELVGTKKK
eukprot:CAMPEP_0113299702 /NCGR_PEP_ID=MMETSP0010_2-20120614/1630_1 /TAXON_ID=216773 ORGANISM="Corethron hystrix, Strain 308" /NCGR_SAMPLE_ID=MMETSP0010_2 /ASSEMBLY_ACC=CAM_ASM_000155 /LENGTH=200 /DNA_ID=CAMNT_0000152987 /DNA_START=820 /DNA_END=1422 /DNA_ORIENTATION=+ /assembly_acc=CAM_ASM_000155